MTGDYKSTDEALQGIAKLIQQFYESKYLEISRSKQLEIRNAVDELQRIYRSTTFPEMNLNWKTHPNNTGHFYFSGCFRCHDGQHISPEGKMVRKDCDICHAVLEQEKGAVRMVTLSGVQFQHPVDLGDLSQVTCSDCHTGGASP